MSAQAAVYVAWRCSSIHSFRDYISEKAIFKTLASVIIEYFGFAWTGLVNLLSTV